MKRIVSFLVVFALTACLMFSTGMAASPAQPQELEVNVITPPVFLK